MDSSTFGFHPAAPERAGGRGGSLRPALTRGTWGPSPGHQRHCPHHHSRPRDAEPEPIAALASSIAFSLQTPAELRAGAVHQPNMNHRCHTGGRSVTRRCINRISMAETCETILPLQTGARSPAGLPQPGRPFTLSPAGRGHPGQPRRPAAQATPLNLGSREGRYHCGGQFNPEQRRH